MSRPVRWLAGLLTLTVFLSLASPALAISRVYYKGNGTCRDIAFTYDVEFNSNTQALADTVDALGIRTTWFFLGDSVAAYPSITRQVAARHQIGNHSYSHPNFFDLTHDQMHSQLSRAEINIANVTGENPEPFWRPPYGNYNDLARTVAEEEGYPYTIMWSIDTRDWEGPSAETIRRRIVDNASPGAIVLMHGFPPGTREGTRLAVGDLRARGYQFVTISEILGLDRTLRDFGGDTYVYQSSDSMDRVGTCHNLTGPRLAAYNGVTTPAPGTTLQVPHTNEIIIRVDGARQTYPVYPRIRDGRSIVHVRVAEQLGATVAWTGSRAVITKGDTTIEITPDDRIALVNGAPVDMGAAALVVNQRILVPVRFVAEAVGATVGWEQSTYTVLINQ